MSSNAKDIHPQDNDAEKSQLLQQLREELHDTDADNSEAGDIQFTKDAAEGLSQIKKDELPAMLRDLNSGLAQHLKKKKRKKKPLPDQSMTYVIIVTLLILIIISYLVIKKMHE